MIPHTPSLRGAWFGFAAGWFKPGLALPSLSPRRANGLGSELRMNRRPVLGMGTCIGNTRFSGGEKDGNPLRLWSGRSLG